MTCANKQEPGESKFKPQEKRAAELKEFRNSMSSKLLSLLVFTRNKLPSRALPWWEAGGRTDDSTHSRDLGGGREGAASQLCVALGTVQCAACLKNQEIHHQRTNEQTAFHTNVPPSFQPASQPGNQPPMGVPTQQGGREQRGLCFVWFALSLSPFVAFLRFFLLSFVCLSTAMCVRALVPAEVCQRRSVQVSAGVWAGE